MPATFDHTPLYPTGIERCFLMFTVTLERVITSIDHEDSNSPGHNLLGNSLPLG
jgi:hypothetical protein